jgi:3-deoxy-D-arabino-heptulosonate 7-phosphate (DAHP) synthase class II
MDRGQTHVTLTACGSPTTDAAERLDVFTPHECFVLRNQNATNALTSHSLGQFDVTAASVVVGSNRRLA